jgi:Zn-dependent protease with chaperone function
MRRIRTLLAGVIVGAVALVASAVPAGAQQLVDAGKEGDGSGGLAFVLFALMAMFIAAALFYMDRIRRRRSQQSDE